MSSCETPRATLALLRCRDGRTRSVFLVGNSVEASALTYSGGVGLHGRSPLLRLQSDERLVALIRRGNDAAFEILVARYNSRLLAFCRHMLASKEDAEDILQDVMAAAYNAILADDRPINVRPWLYRIARNRSLNHLRRAQAVGMDSMDIHLHEHGITTADKAHNREDFRLLVGDIQRLPESQRTALVLREMDALSYEQIADAMETTIPSVKSLLVRARIGLAEASEARRLSCDEVRIELGEVAEGIQRKPGPLVRRHLKTCTRCAAFQLHLKETSRSLALLLPIGPLVLMRKLVLFHLGHSAGSSAGAAATSGAAASSGAGAAAGGAAAGGATAGGALAGGAAAGGAAAGGAGIGALATKAAASLAAAAIVTAGAVEVDHAVQPPPASTPPAPALTVSGGASPAAPHQSRGAVKPAADTARGNRNTASPTRTTATTAATTSTTATTASSTTPTATSPTDTSPTGTPTTATTTVTTVLPPTGSGSGDSTDTGTLSSGGGTGTSTTSGGTSPSPTTTTTTTTTTPTSSTSTSTSSTSTSTTPTSTTSTSTTSTSTTAQDPGPAPPGTGSSSGQ
jgi:RNA polymerase sigma factor (sigma-70 family)